MSLKRILAKILLLAVLEAGAVLGVPMTPQKIAELMNVMNQTKVVRKQDHSGKR